MTTSEECEVCHMPGMMCSHRADLNRAMAMFSGEGRSPNGGLHEFQFFGDGGADSWLVNGPSYGVAAVLEEASLPAEPSFKYMDFLRNTCDPARLTFDAPSSTPTDSSDSTSRSRPKEASAVGKVAPTPMISFSGDGTSTNPPNRNVKEADKSAAASVEGEANAMDREARVLRYREKKKRRKFEKQIRYASRKAYAEMRPRVKGRFAKVPDMSQPSVPASYKPSQLDMGWYQQ